MKVVIEEQWERKKLVDIIALMVKILMKLIIVACLLGLDWPGVAGEDGASGAAAEETIQQLFLREPNDQVRGQWWKHC